MIDKYLLNDAKKICRPSSEMHIENFMTRKWRYTSLSLLIVNKYNSPVVLIGASAYRWKLPDIS